MTDVIAEQDAKLQIISSHVHKLKHSAITISDTIDDHNILLDDLVDNVDNTTGRLSKTTKKIVKLNRTTDSKFCIIGTLMSVINIALFIIYFSI